MSVKVIRNFTYVRGGRNLSMIIECRCGHEMKLPCFTNTCLCGRDYNPSGQLLAPRSQWGRDTGESVDEILSVGHHEE